MIESIIGSLQHINETSIIIAQHMDTLALSSFAKRLNRRNVLCVEFVESAATVHSGRVYVINDTSSVCYDGYAYRIEKEHSDAGFYHPTIDVLFASAVNLKPLCVRAYLLSGIGSDGAQGMLKLRENGCYTVSQDEATSIVYGMPKAAFELGASSAVLSIDAIIADIAKEV